MVLDFGSFTRRGLLVDRARSADTSEWGRKQGKSRGNRTRKEGEEDREAIDLLAVIGP